MKTFLSGASLLIFLISYNVYLFIDKNYHVQKNELKILNYMPILFILAANDFALMSGKISFLQSQFILTSKITLYIVIINILLVQFGIISNDPYSTMLIINSGTALAVLMIIISALRHGCFDN